MRLLANDRIARWSFRIGEGKAHDRPFGVLERKYLWTLPVAVVISLIGTALEGFGIGLLVPLLNVMMAGNADYGAMGVFRPVIEIAENLMPGRPLIAIGAMILALILLKNVVGTVGGLAITRIDGHAGADMRSMIANRLLRLPYSFYLIEEPPRLINIISSDSWRASEVLQSRYGIASSVAAALVLSAFALIANWKLFLIVIFGAIVGRVLQESASRKVAVLSERVSQTNRDLGERMLLIVDLARLIRVFNQETEEQIAFDRESDKVRQAMYDVERASAFYAPFMEIFLAALFIGVMVIAQYMGMTVPEILAFLVLQYRLQPHVLAVNQAYIDLAGLSGSVGEVEWLLGPNEKPPAQTGAPLTNGIDSPIRFERVSYTFPYEEQPVICNASFEIPPGMATALIGRSGAGKSTLVNLLTRLFDASEGRILHGDADLMAIDPASWRSRIALAGQDIDLIEGTVADNIAYRIEGLSPEDIEQAARIADAHDFIMKMPGGYQATIGSYGANLSGGQRQRISLARALVRKPDLLILDEATNAVDGISETVIMRLLQQHQTFGRAIVISHRRSTLSACQHGIVVDHGRIVEAGPLRSLQFYHDMERWPDGEQDAQ